VTVAAFETGFKTVVVVLDFASLSEDHELADEKRGIKSGILAFGDDCSFRGDGEFVLEAVEDNSESPRIVTGGSAAMVDDAFGD